MSVQARKYTVGMILSFATPAAGQAALALGLPSLVAVLAYATAVGLGERFAAALRAALLAGWVAHAIAIIVDIAGLGSDVVVARFGFAPALSMTLWLVLAVYVVESRFARAWRSPGG